MSTRTISAIHHITAIASDPQRNLDFYTEVLGLRLVKLTVNFDDPGTYHFYFGDDQGSPGSILTFFPWPGSRRGIVGNGQVSAIAFSIPSDSLKYWMSRLTDRGVPAHDAGTRFGEPVVRFADPDGTPLELVGTAHAETNRGWKNAGVPPPHVLGGFHSATLSEEGYEKTAVLLQDVMGLELVGSEGNRFRYRAQAGSAGAIVDVICTPDGAWGRLGAGTVHHIAWRTGDDAQQRIWRTDLARDGYNVSPIMDRIYFHSIYFREPGGILFEIATDPPGFAVDEPGDHLGERLTLPPWLETHRTEIERAVPRIRLPQQRSHAR